jgi:hypothetical protein
MLPKTGGDLSSHCPKAMTLGTQFIIQGLVGEAGFKDAFHQSSS